MQWYYAEDGQIAGPHSDIDFVELVENGTIKPKTLVWNETMTDWRSCRSVRKVIKRISEENREVVFEPVTDDASAAEEVEDFIHEAGGAGQTPNAKLTERARAALAGKWLRAVALTILYSIIIQALQGVGQLTIFGSSSLESETATAFGEVLTVIILYVFLGVFQLGVSRFYLDLVRNETLGLNRLFFGFNYFRKAAGAYLLLMLIIVLWSLLFIIPGIVALLSYAMVFYVLADDPEIEISEALSRSKEMMRDHRIKLFCLSCRFIGWLLLGILTCGLGMLWVQPYMHTAFAEFYEDVRQPNQERK